MVVQQDASRIHPLTDDGDDYNPNKNAHLKGRRRFVADLNDMREACARGLVFSGLTMKSETPLGLLSIN